MTYRDASIDSVADHGRHAGVRQLLQLRCGARPADQPDGSRRRAAGRRARRRQLPSGCSVRTSTRSRRPFRFKACISASSGVSAKRGTLLGQSQDEFAVIPLGQFQQMFGARRQLTMSVKPRDLDQIEPAIDDATIAMRIARRLKPSQPDNFAIFNSETVLGHLPIGDERHLRRA